MHELCKLWLFIFSNRSHQSIEPDSLLTSTLKQFENYCHLDSMVPLQLFWKVFSLTLAERHCCAGFSANSDPGTENGLHFVCSMS